MTQPNEGERYMMVANDLFWDTLLSAEPRVARDVARDICGALERALAEHMPRTYAARRRGGKILVYTGDTAQ